MKNWGGETDKIFLRMKKVLQNCRTFDYSRQIGAKRG